MSQQRRISQGDGNDGMAKPALECPHVHFLDCPVIDLTRS